MIRTKVGAALRVTAETGMDFPLQCPRVRETAMMAPAPDKGLGRAVEVEMDREAVVGREVEMEVGEERGAQGSEHAQILVWLPAAAASIPTHRSQSQ